MPQPNRKSISLAKQAPKNAWPDDKLQNTTKHLMAMDLTSCKEIKRCAATVRDQAKNSWLDTKCYLVLKSRLLPTNPWTMDTCSKRNTAPYCSYMILNVTAVLWKAKVLQSLDVLCGVKSLSSFQTWEKAGDMRMKPCKLFAGCQQGVSEN